MRSTRRKRPLGGAGRDPRARQRPRRGEIAWLFHGGRILDARRAVRTSSSGRPARRGEIYPQAVLVRGEVIEAVGPLASVRAVAGRGVHAVDLHGGTLTPGFVDAHIHLLTWLRALEETWLPEQTPEGLDRAVRAALPHAAEGEWIQIRGWVPRDWPRDLKRRSLLDRALPDRPLVLHAVDGHSVWANGAALRVASIDSRTPDPPGGSVDRDAGGEPTGILIEEGASLIAPLVPRIGEPAQALARAIRKAHSLGVTGAHDFDRRDIWGAAQRLRSRGALPFRLLLSIPVAKLDAAERLEIRYGWGDERLRIGPVKMFADGTLGSGTALLEEEYDDDAGKGTEVMSAAELRDRCVRARTADLSVAIHAIGDRAVRAALDAIEAAIQNGGAFPLPPRIEHVQLARKEDLPRFRALGVLASVQPIHVVTDRALARRKWGARTDRSYAYGALARSGARLLFGSDAPFDRAGPLLALQAAVLRRRGEEPESEAFHLEQRLELAKALRAHLEEPNRAAGWSTPLGRIEPGWGADLVVFDRDLLRVGAPELHRARVKGVWVAGSPVYGKYR